MLMDLRGKKRCAFFVLLIFQSKLKVHLFFPKGKNIYVKNEIKELQIVLLWMFLSYENFIMFVTLR